MPDSANTLLQEKLADIRQHIERDPFLHIEPSQVERWIDVEPLLVLRDEEFVRAAYLSVFRREPDPAGLRFNTALLRTGRMNKPELLRSLAESTEGKQYQVRFLGLESCAADVPFEDMATAPAEAFVRCLGRYYNREEPAEDSAARWTALLESGRISRQEVVSLFAASASVRPQDHAAATLTDLRSQAKWHQKAVEFLLQSHK